MADVELVLDARAELGEAPVWDPGSRRLLWVDIARGLIHRFDPVTSGDESVDVGRSVGAAVPAADGGVVFAADDGFWSMDMTTRRTERIAEIEALPDVAMNDGTTDGAGRFWAGTKDADGRSPLGTLYRLDADRSVTRALTGVTISNGLGWSPDQRAMYYIDSATYGIDAFDMDSASGSLSNRRRLVDLPREWGLPDGMTVDAEGFLWVAFWTGSSVRRLDPDGNAVSTIELPVSLVTSCAFGGDELDDLYVTTARIGLSDEQLLKEPNAGGLFRLTPGVRGTPQRPYVT
jgi:sugar lactone lactonase YvrE